MCIRDRSTTVSMTSMIDVITKKYNINCFRTKVGFKYVAPNMEENDSIIGGEESGGYSYSEHLLERDGIVSSLLIIEKLIDSQTESSNLVPDLLKNYGEFFYKRLDIDLDKNILKKFSDFISNYDSAKMIGKNIKSIDKKDQAPVEEKPRPIPFTRTKPPVTTAPVQTSNINTGQQINTSLASLLGSNPIEAAKNMEILQRRNQ